MSLRVVVSPPAPPIPFCRFVDCAVADATLFAAELDADGEIERCVCVLSVL